MKHGTVTRTARTTRTTTCLATGAVAALLGLAACSSSGTTASPGTSAASGSSTSAGSKGTTGSTSGSSAGSGTTPPTKAPVDRPAGPAATLAGPLTAGKGINLLSANPGPPLDAAGYTESEYTAEGTATSYKPKTEGDLPTDGTYSLVTDKEAAYKTRIVVRRPSDPAKFNGTVIVEWLNVSSGADVAPEYTYLAAEILRKGYAWVGVSAQRIGVEGGAVAVAAPGAGDLMGAGKGIKTIDPDRYASLTHPGDGYSYDLFTQIGEAVRKPGAVNPFDGLDVTQLLAVGESQSGFTLTTYANGVQPLTKMFDGFLIHSRGGAPAPVVVPDGGGIDIAGSILAPATKIRTDLAVPVMIVQTESDVVGVLNYFPARQDDSKMVRLWEVAGAAHADKFQVGIGEDLMECAVPINRGQQSYVLKAALRHLDTWARGGAAAPEQPRLEVKESTDSRAYVLDENGNVKGGVRTPSVDAPTKVLSGEAPAGSSIICVLMGSTEPLPKERLTALYADKAAYEAAYAKAADAAIDAGVILEDDRADLLAEADPSALG